MKGKLNLQIVVGLLCCLPLSNKLLAGDWKAELQGWLEARYTLADIDKDGISATQAGTVLVIQKGGVVANSISAPAYIANRVRAGEVSPSDGSAKLPRNTRTFAVGEKAYVSRIDVKDTEVQYFILSRDLFDGNDGLSKRTRFKALVSFEFPNGFLGDTSAENIKKIIDGLLAPEGGVVPCQ